MRDPAQIFGLMPAPDGHPDANAHAFHLRHRPGGNPDPILQNSCSILHADDKPGFAEVRLRLAPGKNLKAKLSYVDQFFRKIQIPRESNFYIPIRILQQLNGVTGLL
jgi:hypothetical protein